MLVPADFILRSLRSEVQAALGVDSAEASASQGILAALQLLDARERGGVDYARGRLDGLARLVGELDKVLRDAPATAAIRADLARLPAAIERVRTEQSLAGLEAGWAALLSEAEGLLIRLAGTAGVSIQTRARLAAIIGTWEIEDRTTMTADRVWPEKTVDTTVTLERLAVYLRDRFNEPDLKVTKFQPLPGGFGKQTILFDVEGRALSGALVMRRDMLEPTVDNDCHRIRNEYPVIRAAHKHGFPAPDALWLDTEHALLPGGDFIVMRCAPGRTGGNVFRATTRLSDDLIKVLATGIVGLHKLPPMVELGDLTDSIRSEWWGLSRKECVRRYIQGWFDLYAREAHNPSPALVSLYGWLLANVPDAPGAPVLLHGDIGFHNMLIDEGRLSVVVDWEFSHIGDPAEEVGYVKNTSGGMDWDAFMVQYRAAGGEEIDPVRLHYFQVWGQVRNASASNATMGKFAIGQIPDLKLAYTGHYHFPHFLRGACDLVEAGPGKATRSVGY